MMRDVDGLNRFYDPLISSYEERREATRLDDGTIAPICTTWLSFPSMQ
jgi:hypothetical protein